MPSTSSEDGADFLFLLSHTEVFVTVAVGIRRRGGGGLVLAAAVVVLVIVVGRMQ